MKIAYTSDIHADITLNNKILIPHLVNRIKEIRPDVFVIAGDVSNSLDSLDVTLKQFNELQCLKFMIPGNHDVWIESNNSVRKGKDSFYKYKQAIPKVCKSNSFLYPITEPYIINDKTAIVGNLGWYDYSLADSRLDDKYKYSDYTRGTFIEGEWNDSKYAVWLKTPDSPNWRERLKRFSNNELFEMLFEEFKASVQKIPECVETLLIVFIQHRLKIV